MSVRRISSLILSVVGLKRDYKEGRVVVVRERSVMLPRIIGDRFVLLKR